MSHRLPLGESWDDRCDFQSVSLMHACFIDDSWETGKWMKMGCYINIYINIYIYTHPYLIYIYIYISIIIYIYISIYLSIHIYLLLYIYTPTASCLVAVLFFHQIRSSSRWLPKPQNSAGLVPRHARPHRVHARLGSTARPLSGAPGAPCCTTHWGLWNCLRWVDGSQKRVIFSIEYLWNIQKYITGW